MVGNGRPVRKGHCYYAARSYPFAATVIFEVQREPSSIQFLAFPSAAMLLVSLLSFPEQSRRRAVQAVNNSIFV